MESNNALSGFAAKMKFQVVAEELVADAADTVQCEAISEQAKGLWNHMFSGESLQ